MISNLYNSKMNVIRCASARDTLGGYREEESVIHTNLPCRINWSRAKEKVMFGKKEYLRDAKVYCSVVDITEKDIVVLNGIQYNIVGIANVDNVDKYLIIDIIKLAV